MWSFMVVEGKRPASGYRYGPGISTLPRVIVNTITNKALDPKAAP